MPMLLVNLLAVLFALMVLTGIWHTVNAIAYQSHLFHFGFFG